MTDDINQLEEKPFKRKVYNAPAQLGSETSKIEGAVKSELLLQINLEELSLIVSENILMQKKREENEEEEEAQEDAEDSQQAIRRALDDGREKIQELIPDDAEQAAQAEEYLKEYLENLAIAKENHHRRAIRIYRLFSYRARQEGYSEEEAEQMSNENEQAVANQLKLKPQRYSLKVDSEIVSPSTPSASQLSMGQRGRAAGREIDLIVKQRLKDHENSGLPPLSPVARIVLIKDIINQYYNNAELQYEQSQNNIPVEANPMPLPVARVVTDYDPNAVYVDADSVAIERLDACENSTAPKLTPEGRSAVIDDVRNQYENSMAYRQEVNQAEDTLVRRVEVNGLSPWFIRARDQLAAVWKPPRPEPSFALKKKQD